MGDSSDLATGVSLWLREAACVRIQGCDDFFSKRYGWLPKVHITAGAAGLGD
jgi:hypothetical protein